MAKTEFLIEDPSLGYELNEDDILQYAKQIGIDLQNEKHLMWIAEEGLAANVPEPWLILSDEKGRIFYSNYETGEKSWCHPLDKEYAALVVQERRKFLHSPLSNCGFESKLSSLSDAPPLSSSGKTTPSSLKPASSSATFSERKIDSGHFENRRGTKLAPVRLNALKMPAPSAAPKSSGMSFMPKGTSLSRNIRRINEEDQSANQIGGIRNRMTLPQEDFNEDLNSDDGSKYSYEETDDDMEKSYDDMNQSDGGSYFSPPHSTNDSPEALDINSLVQLGTKLPPRLDAGKKVPKLQVLNEDQPPSLSLRKAGQPSFLKPMQLSSKKKATPKKSKKVSDLSDHNDTEDDFDSKIAALNEEQRLRFESIQKEWAAMLDELEKQEKAKYDQMLNESSKKLEEEKSLIKKENNEKISELKKELLKKIEEEKSSGQINLDEIKKENQQKLLEEEQKFKQKLDSLTDTLKTEVEKIEQENVRKINEKKKQLDEENKKEIEEMKSLQQINIKKIEESHADEIAVIKEAHKEKIGELQNSLAKEEDKAKSSSNADKSSTNELQSELAKIQGLLKEETEKYQQLLNELNKLKEDIASEKEVLLKLEEKSTSAQNYYEEIQEEVDKTESDLDLLRNEKSALISELNILKENINNGKSNLKEIMAASSPSKKANLVQKGVNTEVHRISNQSSQTITEVKDGSCQTKEVEISKMDRYSQTNAEKKAETFNISCQVELLQPSTFIDKNETHQAQSDLVSANISKRLQNTDASHMSVTKITENENINLDILVNKVLENALTDINNKIEARLKSIEKQLSSVQKESNSSPKRTTNLDSTNKNIPTEVKSVSNVIHPTECFSFNPEQNSSTLIKASIPSSNNCSCEIGDVGSCQVMQDVKNSIYRLNDILSTSYVPSLGNNVLLGYNHLTNNHSPSLQSFYSQYRQLQEKQRITELKHKLQNGSTSQQESNVSYGNFLNDVTRKESPQFSRALQSSSVNVSYDPYSRAKNLVLREQARSWKQQQQFLSSSDMQGFLPIDRSFNTSISDNISPSASSRISSGFSENSSAHQFPFLKFEPDPETEYNEWMARLKTLQDKIRNHRLI
ncbi:uncharacterized protein TNCT_463091 [Trichonephila clavata]|uniref:WW domain-containing protein n=1 Tax=Trichonephila clavata TaxID=2740835 RepID=A0A8X6HPL5_TRICU|nr:uncharacterized protein TNCT_463091 [Trichonephila clavata]